MSKLTISTGNCEGGSLVGRDRPCCALRERRHRSLHLHRKIHAGRRPASSDRIRWCHSCEEMELEYVHRPRSAVYRTCIPAIEKMSNRSRFRVRIIERDGDRHDVGIDISAWGEAVAPVRALCSRWVPLNETGMAALDWIAVESFKSIARAERRRSCVRATRRSARTGRGSRMSSAFSNSWPPSAMAVFIITSPAPAAADKVLHFGSRTTPVLSIRVSFCPGKRLYGIDPEADDSDGSYMPHESSGGLDREDVRRFREDGAAPDGDEAEIGESASETLVAKRLRQQFDRWRPYRFHDTSFHSPMKKTADVNDNRRLRPDDANLAAFLYFLGEKRAGKYDPIRRTRGWRRRFSTTSFWSLSNLTKTRFFRGGGIRDGTNVSTPRPFRTARCGSLRWRRFCFGRCLAAPW